MESKWVRDRSQERSWRKRQNLEKLLVLNSFSKFRMILNFSQPSARRPIWPSLGQLGSNLDDWWPSWRQLKHNFAPTWANFAPNWANLGLTWSNLNPTWPNLLQFGANFGQLVTNLVLMHSILLPKETIKVKIIVFLLFLPPLWPPKIDPKPKKKRWKSLFESNPGFAPIFSIFS